MVCLGLVSCSINEAVEVEKEESELLRHRYYWEDREINGMKYRIVFKLAGSDGAGALYIINLTKDELEVKLLRKQLEE